MVSVIIPNFNRENLIERAVQSVLNQTYSDIEVIVVDDCSTDHSVDILNKICDKRFYLYKLKSNSGACIARNKGIDEARGNYIAFLDSDDEWLPYKLEKQMAYFDNVECDALFSQYYYHELDRSKDKIEVRPKEIDNNIDLLGRILFANCVAMDTLIVKRKVFSTIRFDENLPRYQDWDLAIQIARNFNIRFYDEPVLNVYEQSNSITYSTSKEKKFQAIEYLYTKHYSLIKKYPKAESHFLWTMGLYSLCTKRKNIEYIKKSIILDKCLKKKFTLILINLGFGSIIARIYAKRH